MPVSGRGLEKRHRKFIATGSQFLAVADLVAGSRVGWRREEASHQVFAGSLADAVGEHEEAGFLVLGLPGVEEVVGGGEGEDVVLIDARVGNSGPAERGDRERR